MMFTCPITGDVIKASEDAKIIVIDHPELGRYSLDTTVFHEIKVDARTKERLAHWIAECHSVGMEVPPLGLEAIQFFERLADLESDAATWHELRGGMRKEDADRLWQKLRLEWNYNSNHIEGNTLTYGETELLFHFDRTTGGHPLRHYEEMKAHDVAIEHTRRLACDEQILGEKDISSTLYEFGQVSACNRPIASSPADRPEGFLPTRYRALMLKNTRPSTGAAVPLPKRR